MRKETKLVEILKCSMVETIWHLDHEAVSLSPCVSTLISKCSAKMQSTSPAIITVPAAN